MQSSTFWYELTYTNSPAFNKGGMIQTPLLKINFNVSDPIFRLIKSDMVKTFSHLMVRLQNF